MCAYPGGGSMAGTACVGCVRGLKDASDVRAVDVVPCAIICMGMREVDVEVVCPGPEDVPA